MNIAKTDGISKYARLADALKQRIVDDKMSIGDRFLSERRIMKEYSVSSATVGKAMRLLCDEGVFSRRIGGGTFVKQIMKSKSEVANNVLAINAWPTTSMPASNPLNWFIFAGLLEGIINSHNGPVRVYGRDRFLEELAANSFSQAIVTQDFPEVFSALKERNTPYVKICLSNATKTHENVIKADHIGAVYDLMSYLIHELGHQRIAMITTDNSSHIDRLAGYQIALNANKLPINKELVIHTAGTRQAGYDAAEQLLSLGEKPTAIFADTDLKALGAMDAVKACGLSVPEDLSVIGFDDINDAANYNPALTTIRFSYTDIGATAVAALEGVAEQGLSFKDKAIKGELIIRESCAKNPRGA